nr:MAG TPA: Lysozyme [Caudoviricetes sp.]
MNNFELAVELTLQKEGLLSEHKDDAGGLTKYGISKAAYPTQDIANLTKEQAIAIYKRDYWKKAQCDEIPYPLDVMLFDTAVNHGVVKAVKILQESLGVVADGVMGQKTRAAARTAKNSIYTIFMLNRLYAYTDAKSWPTFKDGWKDRLVQLAKEVDA